MTDYRELKKLAEEVNSAFPDKEDLWSMVCTPSVALDLIDDIERLTAALSAPEDITAEPAADYEGLRKQFLALRALANSNSRMVSHWRNQCGIETRETLLANAANVNAERDTNQVLTHALLDIEEQLDQLKAENARSTEREIHQLAEIEALRKNSARYLHLKANWEDGLLLERLMGNVLPQDWDAEIDKDMSKESP